MKHFVGACLCVLAAAAVAPAQDAALKEARLRWLKGNYEEARAKFEELARDAKLRPAATVGLSRALQSQGEYAKAQEVVEAALKDNANHVGLLARKAEVLYVRGRWDDAAKTAEEGLKGDDKHLAARWVRAQVARDKGDLKTADAEFRWFVRYYTERSNADNDIKDAEELVLVGLAGVENARWHNLSDQFDFILNEVYKDALKADKDLWQAEYHAGRLLLEKYNRRDGMPALENALKINPNAAEALAAKGVAALQKYEIKEAEEFAERALKINPNLPEALRLRADVHLMAGDVTAALGELEQARKVNPADEETLSRVAACLFLQKKQAAFDALVKEVEGRDAKPAVFYHELAQRIEERRRFDQAEGFYKKAAELRPMLPWPQNNLGLLYMRMGREKEARAVLEKAFESDPFNVRVSNTRKVLKHLDQYETIKTEHFELRYDPKTDAALARYMAEYLEDIYKELAEKFRYRPKGPILIEVFNSHEMFSGRTVALPDLHTIGACTGRMIAMASTHAKGIRKPFNWARVLRHEVVHIFNLEQTDFQVPHWLTEGLAVINEGGVRPQPWNQLLVERVPKGELMNLDTIDLGFIRPKSPLDWNMAYCQSQLYVQFMTEKYGPHTVGEMLEAYRGGADTASAIRKVCKVDKAEFEKGYKAYLDGVVRTLKGRPAEKPMTLTELRDAHQKDPDDADVAARLAEQLYRRDRVEAHKLANAVLAKKPNHPLASFVKAKLVLQSGDVDQARKLLEAALDRDNPEPRVLLELGKMAYEAGDHAKAAEIFELGRRAEPYDSQWLVQLARVHAQTGNKMKQIEVLKALVPTDPDDLEHRKRLAKLLAEAGKQDEAERYARLALEIDVKDAEAREVLFKALDAQGKGAEAAKMKKILQEK